MSAQRKHHFVPQFHLRRFANEKSQVKVTKRSQQQTFIANVEDACAERDFYRIDVPALDNNAVEDFLSQIESDAAPAIERIATGDFRAEDREAISLFVAFQCLRGDEYRMVAQQVFEEGVKFFAKHLESNQPFLERVFRTKHDRIPTTKELEEVGKAVREAHARRVARVDPQESIRAMLRSAPRLAGILCARDWLVFQVKGRRMLTSDACVASWEDMARPGALLYGGSWATADEVYLPISPNQCLHILAKDIGPLANTIHMVSASKTEQYVERINQTIAARARLWIVQHPQSDVLSGIVLPPVRPPLRFD